LDYISLGQSLNTYSGGEIQRLKLAKALAKKQTDKNMYLLDEPTTGLHFEDIKKLIKLFKNMVNLGHCIILTEHNEDMINHADHIIELGPVGGDEGGYLL
jgi:excinuclease ABC subunit A